MALESIASTLIAMLAQEEVYTCRDFILQDSRDARFLSWRASLLNGEDLDMSRAFRRTMVGWAYQVTDFVKFQRETVEFATSYFDRFLQTHQGRQALQDRGAFQTAFITCLYLATKLHEPTTMSPAFLSILSKGEYTMSEIERMEVTLLAALKWRVNPPTALSFVQHFIALHPLTPIIPPSLRDAIYDLAKVQIELMVDDYRFVTVPRSTIALAAVTNALESLQADPNELGMARFAALTKATKNMEEVASLRTALYQVISKLPHIAHVLPKALTSSSCRGLEVGERLPSYQQSPRAVYQHDRIGNFY